MNRRLAVIGASYLQLPLILQAQDMGLETHVFAWENGDVGERAADYFYPISIVEKEAILNRCRKIGIEGVCTIASDLASITVGYVARNMGLVGNPPNCIESSTDKHLMRRAFQKGGDPSPRSIPVDAATALDDLQLSYPIIVKPSDRSGSRGITKLDTPAGLHVAVERAISASFSGIALVEEFVAGTEYSVEFISWNGRHSFLAITEKFTTGTPNFIERGHMQPASIHADAEKDVRETVAHALDSLGITYGASHSEVKIDEAGNVKLIEIGARMGGDFIGSHLVRISRCYNYLKAVIDIALGQKPAQPDDVQGRPAGVRFVLSQEDIDAYHEAMTDSRVVIEESSVPPFLQEKAPFVVSDSSARLGYFLISSNSIEAVRHYMPPLTPKG